MGQQQNHFTIRQEGGGGPLIEITRRADVADGELVELLQLFVAAMRGSMGEAQADTSPRSLIEAKPGDLPILEWDGPYPGISALAIPELRNEEIRRAFCEDFSLFVKNEQSKATPLGILTETAGLKEPNVVDLELVRLRMKNTAMREAFGHTLSEPEEG